MRLLSAITFVLFTGFISTLYAQEQEYQPVKRGSYEPEQQAETDTATNRKSTAKESTNLEKNDKKWKWEDFRIGGNFGLSFGSVTYVEVSPAFSYWILPEKFQTGISTKFIYQNVRYIDNTHWKSFLYGGGVFTDYVIWRGIFAHGEYELINKESYFSTDRVNVSHLLLGGGYIQPVGQAGHFYISALFNVLDSDESIYTGMFGNLPLILRMGFGFGFPGRNR